MSSSGEHDNRLVFDGQQAGHYEVYYLKLNVPPRAWWIRYTVLSPTPGRGSPVGELWAIAFNREAPERNRAFKETYPWSACQVERSPFALRVGTAELTHRGATGAMSGPDGTALRWDLRFEDERRPFHHYPHAALYKLPFPKTKVVAPHLSMGVSGQIEIDGEVVELQSAPGHQAHIWGTKHAERWAWANCTAFDDAPGAVLECLTAQIPLGPIRSPLLTLAALRLPDGQQIDFNRMRSWVRHTSCFDLMGWRLLAERGPWRLEVDLRNRIADMVGVRYEDPDGEGRVCHNSKVADATVTLLRETRSGWSAHTRLSATGTVAFEVVQPHGDPRVPVLI